MNSLTMRPFLLPPLLLLLLLHAFHALHIGLICPGHLGHLNPTATLGAELLRRGHRVTLISTPPGSITAQRHGLEFQPLGIPEYQSGALRVDLEQEGRLRGLPAFWHTLQLFKREAKIILRDLPQIFNQQGIDAVCVDQLSPAAMDVAEVHEIPAGVLCTALPLHLDPNVPPFMTIWSPSNGSKLRSWRNQASNIAIMTAAAPLYIMLNRYRAKHGLAWHKPNSVQSVGNIQLTQIPSFLDFPRTRLPDHFFYSRPWHCKDTRDVSIPFPWQHLLNKQPIVYASFGSVQTGLRSLYLAVAEACGSLDVQLIMSLGRNGAFLPPHLLPSNALVVDFAPQLQLLQKASVVLTHGGLNTALEALSCGLPIVTVPLCNDQPGIAARLVNLGVAKAVPPGRASPKNLRQAIVQVMEEPRYRNAATRYKRRMQDDCPTLAQAAELIETGLGRSTPILRDDPEVTRIFGLRPVANLTFVDV